MESGIRENFACEIPESRKILLVESGIREKFARGIRNPGNVCLQNPESGKFLLVESGIRESFACGIRNLGNFILWNPESWALEFGSQLKESGILLTIGIRNLSPTDTDWNQVPGIRNSTGVESRIQDCLGFTCMGGEECGLVPVDGIPS